MTSAPFYCYMLVDRFFKNIASDSDLFSMPFAWEKSITLKFKMFENKDVNLKIFDDAKFIKELFDEKKTVKYWMQVFKTMKKELINTWDYQWTFTFWNNKQLTILPNTNMIENVGFGADATHTTGESEFANLKAYELTLKTHPKEVKRDLEADKFTSKKMFEKKLYLQELIIN